MSTLLHRARSALAGTGSWGLAAERSGEDLPRGGARGSAWMAVAALLVGVVATPFGLDLGRADFGRLVDGALELQGSEGWRDLEAPAVVPAGAELRTGQRPARIEVAGGVLTLAEDTQLHAHPDEPRVRGGSLLIEADEPLRIRVGATTAEGRGQWRADVDVASRVATYRARVDLDDGASERRIDRFRQVSIRDGGLEPGLRPLRYTEDDTWDEWLLADALAVDRLSARLHSSLERSHGQAPRGPDFYAAFVAVDDADLADDLPELALTVDGEVFGPPADVLVGVAAVDALATEAGFTPQEALERAVDLRRAGATWGLVLVEHDLGAAALRAAADRALQQAEQTPPPEAPADADEGAVPVVPVGTEEAEPTPPGEGGGAQPEPTPPPSPGPAPRSPDDDDQDGGGGPAEPVEDIIRDTRDTVGDTGGDTGDAVGDLLRDTTDTLGDAVGDVGSLLEPSGSSDASGSADEEGDGEDDVGERGGLLGR